MKKILWFGLAVMLIAILGVLIAPNAYLSAAREFEEISIQGDGYQLHASVSEGTDPGGNWIFMVHGNRGVGQEHELYRRMREFIGPEFSVLAIDLHGFGGSAAEDGNQQPESIDRSVDLLSVENYLSLEYGVHADQIVLIGHSFGAAQVLSAGQNRAYLAVIPIGLGDWDALLTSDAEIDGYIEKFFANTGIRVDRELMIQDARNYTMESLSKDCPETSVWFVYASQDDAIPGHREAYQSFAEECPGMFYWSEVPLSDHMYGTEMVKLPEPLRGIYSRISLSFLKYRLGQILSMFEN